MAKDLQLRGEKFVKGKLKELMEGKPPEQKERLMMLYRMAVSIAKKQREKRKAELQELLGRGKENESKQEDSKNGAEAGRDPLEKEQEGEKGKEEKEGEDMNMVKQFLAIA